MAEGLPDTHGGRLPGLIVSDWKERLEQVEDDADPRGTAWPQEQHPDFGASEGV